MKKNSFRNLFLKLWPILVIGVVWFIFSSPYFIKNKVPFSSTYLVNFFSPWNAYQGFASPVKNNAMPDVISQMYPWKNFTINEFKNLRFPLWNQYSFSGTPHLANYQSAVLSPFNLLFFILPFIDAWSLFILLQPLLAGLFTYLFLRALSLNKASSVLGSLAFMFCGFITTWMAYGTLSYAILFLPLALYGIEKYYTAKKIRFLLLFSFSIPFSFFSGHFQISLYFLIFVISYLVFKFLSTKDTRKFVVSSLYLLAGILISFPQLLPSIELYLQSLRSSIFQKIEVIPWGYISTFVAPDFLGNPVTRNDWFGHYAEWNAYIGLIPLMLALFAILRDKTKYVLFFLLAGLAAIFLSFQTPLLDLLIFLKIPVVSTSAASRIIVLFSFSMSVLSAFGFQKLYEDIKEKNRKIFYWLAFFAFIFAFLWGIVILKLFMPLDKIIIARQNLLLPTILFVLLLILVVVSAFNIFKVKNKNIFYLLLPFILIGIVSFDMLRFAGKWMPFDSRNLMYPDIAVSKEFSKLSNVYRSLGNFGTEANMYYDLPSVEGYDAVYIKRYGEFIASLKYGDLTEASRSVVTFDKNGLYTKEAVNLLGIKYIVHKVADDHASWTFPFWEAKEGTFSKIYDDGVYQVYQNNEVFPRAFLADKYLVAKSRQQILNKMFSSNLNLRNEVVLEQDPKLNLGFASGSARITEYKPEKIVINTNADGNSLLFLSDTFYPGWEAFVDGKKTEIYRADYTFRALFVPKGVHQIIFRYNPLSFRVGIIFALFGLIMLPLFVVFGRKRLI